MARRPVQDELDFRVRPLLGLVGARCPRSSSGRRRTRPWGSHPRRWRTRADGPRCARRDGSVRATRATPWAAPTRRGRRRARAGGPSAGCARGALGSRSVLAIAVPSARRPIGSGVFRGPVWCSVGRRGHRLDVFAAAAFALRAWTPPWARFLARRFLASRSLGLVSLLRPALRRRWSTVLVGARCRHVPRGWLDVGHRTPRYPATPVGLACTGVYARRADRRSAHMPRRLED